MAELPDKLKKKRRTLMDKASKAMSAEKYGKAFDLFSECAELTNDATAMRRAGDALVRLNRNPEAVRFYERAARTLAEEGYQMRALAVYKLVLQIDPANVEVARVLQELHPTRPSTADLLKRGQAAARTPEPAVATAEPPPPPPLPPPSPPSASPSPSPSPSPSAEPPQPREVAPPATRFFDDAELGPGAEPSFEMMADDLLLPTAVPEALPPIPLFSSLPQEAFRETVMHMERVDKGKGEQIFEEGDAANGLWVVARGEVAIYRMLQSRRRILARLQEGEFFGEMGLISGLARSASARAERNTELFFMPRELLARVAREHPGVGQVLQRFYKERLLDGLVKTSPLFAALPGEEHAGLLSRLRVRGFPTADVIVHLGEPSDGLHVIVSGHVRVASSGRDGNDVEIAMLGPGEFFGEMSLLQGTTAIANVSAQGPVRTLFMDRASFRSLIMENPMVLESIGSIAEERRRRTDEMLGAGGYRDGTLPLV